MAAPRSVVHPRIAVRRRATRATAWWGKAWVRAVEESAFAQGDLALARALSRSGRVGGITVDVGSFVAAVEDDHGLWSTAGTIAVLEPEAIDALVETVAAESGRIASLLAGDLPHSLVEHAEEAGVELLPYGGELGSSCPCGSWVDPCLHALAVLYQLTWLIEGDPFVLLHLRGLPREELLARLHERTVEIERTEQIERTGPTQPEAGPEYGSDDLETGLDAALRAARLLELLDDPDETVDHLV